MRLASRIGVGFLGLVALMVAVGVYQLSIIDRLRQESLHLSQTGFEAGRSSLRLQRAIWELSELTERLQVLGDGEYAAGLAARREQAADLVAELRRLPLSDLEGAVVQELADLWAGYAAGAAAAEARRVEWGSGRSLDPQLANLSALRSVVGRLMESSEMTMSLLVAASAERVDRARDVALVAWLVGALAAIVFSGLLVRSIAGSLGRVRRGARILGGGELSYRVPVEGPEEFSALAADFNSMADRLEELERLKRDFVSMVSHELKAPLASMQETLRLVLDGSLGPLDAEQGRILRLTEASADRLSGMIHDLLDLACLEAGAMEYDFRSLDLREIVLDALAEFAPSIDRQGLECEADLPSGPVPVAADRALLRQVLQNLISNAVKFTPSGGVVAVAVRPLGEGVRLTVADSGPGIADEHKERVFERFHRSDARVKGSQGSGLGLAIARGIVTGHGGKIWVEDRPGGGSAFVVLLRPGAVD